MPTDFSIPLINPRNPHSRQAIANLIHHSKALVMSSHLALLDQLCDAQRLACGHRQSTLDKGRGMEGLAAGEYFAYWPVMLKADLAHA